MPGPVGSSGSTYARLAPHYDRLIGRGFFAGVRLAFERLVRRYGIRFGSVADLGCGTGLFACYLSRRWRVPVLGVDRSGAMLRVAARNCAGRPVRFLRQDLRRLALPRRVDLATANFDTLNHLLQPDELSVVLRRVRASLRPGGHFIFDLITPCLVAGARPTCRSLPDGATMCHRIEWRSKDGLFRTTIAHHGPGPSRSGRVAAFERAYRPEEVAHRLVESGFEVRGIHDAATLDRLRDGCAARVVFVARATSGA